MNYFRASIIIFSFFLFVTQAHAGGGLSFSGQVEAKFVTTVTKILSLNREIKNNPRSILLERVFSQRNTYTRYAQSLYRHMELNRGLTPTLDVSARYKLSLQKYALSCEIAALRMIVEALSGKYISEETIMREIPYNPLPLANGVWGDPEKEFVGSYSGSQAKKTGYGVYGLPLARFLDKRGYDNEYRNTLMSTGGNADVELSYALKSLEQGDHIIFWADWCTTPTFDDGIVNKIDIYVIRTFSISARNECERSSTERKISWNTPENTRVQGVSGEHAFLLLGYIGTRENPSHIIVWDTDTGKHIYPILEWMRKWSVLDYRMLVIKDNSISGNKK